MFVFWWKKEQRGNIDDTEKKVKKIISDVLEEVRGDEMNKWKKWPESKNGSFFAIKRKKKYVGTDSYRMIDLVIEFLEILF